MSQKESRMDVVRDPRVYDELGLAQCLWNVARHAHRTELPAIRRLLGEDQTCWVQRAWVQADRWGNESSRAAETALLLSVGGIDIEDSRRIVGEHLVQLGLRRENRSGTPMTAEQNVDAARLAVGGILEQILWPASRGVGDLGAFSSQRRLKKWGPTGSGCFRSGKLGRLVEYESRLELQVLRYLDRDSRVVAFVEQPLTVPYVIDEKAREYTPDVAVLLDDGSVFLMEIKPASMLGGMDVTMKLAALARFCGQNGYGLYAGSPDCGLLDFRAVQPDPAARDLVREDLRHGPITGRSFRDLVSLIKLDALSALAAAELLDWRTGSRRIAYPHPADMAEALRFWTLVDKHKPLPPQSVLAAPCVTS